MTLRNPKVVAWEERLLAVFHIIDGELEAKFGDRFPLHPARARDGQTVNPSASGLFELGAAFSAGYGSKHGRGYIIDVRIATLENIPADIQEKLEVFVADRLRLLLPEHFPGQDLQVERDGPVFKIIGELSI